MHACESLKAGHVEPPQEAEMVTLLLLLFVPDPHDLEHVLHGDQEETEQLTVRKKR